MPIEQESNIIYFILPLIAVLIGGLLSWIPIRWRLKHDSREREKERQMSIRQDVYLLVAEKIGQQLSYLTNFYQTKESTPKGYDEAVIQIHMLGNDDTIVAINQFNDHIVEAFYELIPKRSEIDLLDARHEYLTKALDLDIQEPKKIINEFKKIYKERVKLIYKLAEECRRKTQLAEELLTPVIVAIRKEMNAPFSEAEYQAMMKTSQNKWKESLEKYIASMKGKHIQELQMIEQLEQEIKI